MLAVEKRVTSVLIEPSSIEKVFEVDDHIGLYRLEFCVPLERIKFVQIEILCTPKKNKVFHRFIRPLAEKICFSWL